MPCIRCFGWWQAALLIGPASAMAGAPLKGVDVKLGKSADARCAAPGAIASPSPAPAGTAEPAPAQCAEPEPTPTATPEAAGQAGKSAKTRSNIQNN